MYKITSFHISCLLSAPPHIHHYSILHLHPFLLQSTRGGTQKQSAITLEEGDCQNTNRKKEAVYFISVLAVSLL